MCVGGQNVLMGTLNVAGKGLIASLEEYIGDVLKPALKAIPSWGELDKSPYGKKLARNFVENVESFVGSLHGLFTGRSHCTVQ